VKRVDQEINFPGFVGDDPTDPTARDTDSVATTTYQYDEAGRRKSMTDPTFKVTRYWYDLVGNLVETMTPTGYATFYQYDVRNQKTEENRSQLQYPDMALHPHWCNGSSHRYAETPAAMARCRERCIRTSTIPQVT